MSGDRPALRRPGPLRSHRRPGGKKIFPALHAMARRGHLDFPVIGVARSEWTLDELQERRPRERRAARRRRRREGVGEPTRAAPLRRRQLRGPGHVHRAPQGAGRGTRIRCTTSRSRRACSRPSSRGSAKSSCAQRRARHPGEAVRPRPRVGAGAERDARTTVFDESAHLPHRPLPRQGGGAEPPRLPLREHLPRADLEPPLRQERAGHDGRALRRRRAAASSTRRPAPSAT